MGELARVGHGAARSGFHDGRLTDPPKNHRTASQARICMPADLVDGWAYHPTPNLGRLVLPVALGQSETEDPLDLAERQLDRRLSSRFEPLSKGVVFASHDRRLPSAPTGAGLAGFWKAARGDNDQWPASSCSGSLTEMIADGYTRSVVRTGT